MRFINFLLFLTIVSFVQAQTSNIGGIINNYASAISIDACKNTIEVDDASSFSIGDKVLLIQMKGAVCDLNNSANFGEINSLGNAGIYEFNVVEGVTSNSIELTYTLDPGLSVGSVLQLVRIPLYTNAVVDSLLRPLPWDGSKGGIVAFECSGSLTLNDNIDVSASGFRGGATINHPNCENFNNGSTVRFCTSTDECGAFKGEGIALSDPVIALGAGSLANGGGGGNDHNTGGGGGGHVGRGGSGGERFTFSGFSCKGPLSGQGGYDISYISTEPRLFMGGGGGAGDMNNNTGTPGTNGGGIVYLKASSIIGNNNSILSNGGNGGLAGPDGAGGGGAGGSLLLDVNGSMTGLNLEVIGGKGSDGDNGNDTTFCFGQGGGGSGGAMFFTAATIPGGAAFSVDGGKAGIATNINIKPACQNFNEKANDGSDGQTFTSWQVKSFSTPFEELKVSTVDQLILCEGVNQTIVANVNNSQAGILWSNGDLGPQASITATDNTTLIVTAGINNGQCIAMDTTDIEVIKVPLSIETKPGNEIILGEEISFFVTPKNYISYTWTPVTGLDDPNSRTPIAKPNQTTIYCVTAEDSSGCKKTVCREIEVVIPQIIVPDAFTPNNDGVNDIFVAYIHPKLEFTSIKIFNRWGEMVFESVDQMWDGTQNGKSLPMETYVYEFKADVISSPGNEIIKKGSLVLIR